MSDYLSPSSASASTTISQLKWYLDFERWAQDLQIACQYKGIWNLFVNDEEVHLKDCKTKDEYLDRIDAL
jgi:hypothetical protein